MISYNKQEVSLFPYIDAWCWGIVTNLKSASKDTDHEHDYGQIVSKHIPPWLQNSERWLLFRELSKFHHRNHAACYKTMENDVTWPSEHLDTEGWGEKRQRQLCLHRCTCYLWLLVTIFWKLSVFKKYRHWSNMFWIKRHRFMDGLELWEKDGIIGNFTFAIVQRLLKHSFNKEA